MVEKEFNIDKEERGEITILRPNGPVDAIALVPFKKTIDALCKSKKPCVILDGVAVTYLDSQAAGLVATLHRQALLKGGRVVLCGLSPRIERSLDLLGLGQRLDRYANVDEALASFEKS